MIFLFLAISFPATGRTEGNTTCPSHPLPSCPKPLRSLLVVWQPSCWDVFAAYLQNQWRIIISGLYHAGKFLCDVPYLVSRELTHLLCAEFSERVRPLKRELPITTTLLFSLIVKIVMTGSTSQSLPQSPVLLSLSTSSLSSTTRIISLVTTHTVVVPAALWEQHQVLALPRA